MNADTNITIKSLLAQESTKKRLQEIIGKNAPAFASAVISIASNYALQDCEPKSLLGACIAASTLNLEINQNLGYAYIVPYTNKGIKQAQFQVGYKGFIQLAQRSGSIAKLTATMLTKSQFKSFDPIVESLEYDFENNNDTTPAVYVGYLELINGFKKYSVMTVEQLQNHGQKYSKSYNHSSSLWKNNFDAMAKKTVTKLLLHYAPLSVELQTAIKSDQAVIDGDSVTYVDNPFSQEKATNVPTAPISEDEFLNIGD